MGLNPFHEFLKEIYRECAQPDKLEHFHDLPADLEDANAIATLSPADLQRFWEYQLYQAKEHLRGFISAYFHHKESGDLDQAEMTLFHIGMWYSVLKREHGEHNQMTLESLLHRLKGQRERAAAWGKGKDLIEFEGLPLANRKWLEGDPSDHCEMAEFLASKICVSKSKIMRNEHFLKLAKHHNRCRGVKGFKKK